MKEELPNLLEIINTRLLQRLQGVEMRVLIWIANNNARKIQEVYSERLFIKRRAANSI